MRLFGTTRRARLLTLVTVAALAIAVIAFLALEPSDEESPRLSQMDARCVAEKERITTLEHETLQQSAPDLEEFAAVLVTILAEWRANTAATRPAAAGAEEVEALQAALREVMIAAGALARTVRESPGDAAVGAAAGAVDEASAEVDRAIEDLGLEECSALAVGPAAGDRP